MAKIDLTKNEIEVLVGQAQEGDTQAFAKVYDVFVDSIYRYIFFKVKKDDALDLTETVFLKVWENLKSYRRGDSYFSSWIFRIAHNVVVDHYRLSREYAQLDQQIPDEKPHNNPVHQTEERLSQDTLRKAIRKLKRSYQQVILLKYVNDLENHEIARILKRSEGNLRILKFRALKALKAILESMNVTY
jgi:RNA polymerase sigma-70 factor, ECF subfamily